MRIEDPSKPPSFDLFCAWVASRGKYPDGEFVRNWWDEMENVAFWRAKKTGEPISHWPALFDYCYKQAHRAERREEKRARREQRAIEAKEAKVEEAAKVDPSYWALCQERCANAKAEGGCRLGAKFPPDKNPVPFNCRPPEECRGFKKVGAA